MSLRGENKKSGGVRALLAALLAVSLALHSSPAHAQAATPASTPTYSGPVPDLQTACGSILSNPACNAQSSQMAGATPTGTPSGCPADPSGQKAPLCQSAKSAQDAADAASAGWKVWALVAGVCTVACAVSFTPAAAAGYSYACSGASIAGGIADAAITKNFTGALSGIMMGGMGIAMTAMATKEVAKEGAKKSGSGDMMACMSAAMAALQVFMKASTESSSNSQVQSLLKQIAALQSTNSTLASSGGSGFTPTGTGSANAPNPTGASGNSSGTQTGAPTAAATSTPCGASASSPSTGAFINCAAATDGNLPPFASDGRGLKDLVQAGRNPDAITGAGDPKGALMAAMGGSFTPSGLTTLASTLDDMQQKIGAYDGISGAYASGGGGGEGGEGGGDGGDAQMAAMMAQMMDAMNPNAKKGEKPTGVAAVVFAAQVQKRSPSAIAEDHTLSIFDRITYRYIFVGRMMLGIGGAR
jgi:hypothetical protein